MKRSAAVVATVLAAGFTHAETIRIATFNTSLNFPRQGEIARALEDGNLQRARKIAAIIQKVRPDILLIQEFDYDASGRAAELFQTRFLGKGQFGEQPIRFADGFQASVNTGVSTGLDLNGDGKTHGPADAHGWGDFPGQYGMLVLSNYPFDREQIRTFQKFLWRDMPGVRWPRQSDGQPYYSKKARDSLRLSSKSHWDLPIQLPGLTIHFLVSHPTPPVFDGPEDRNGIRNRDEIRFWRDYLDGKDYFYDDQGRLGGLKDMDFFILAGDLNADPYDGDSTDQPARALLDHPKIFRASDDIHPVSDGALEQAGLGLNATHRGNPQMDTGDFGNDSVGNLRVDYVLPDNRLKIRSAGVFWPTRDKDSATWLDASDHRLVWVDIELPRQPEALPGKED